MEEAISAEGEDLPDLLHAWLTEILFHAVSEAKVYDRFEVSRISPSSSGAPGSGTGGDGWRIEGTARGEAFDPARHALLTELKAVTYHDLSVGEKNGRFEATALFDV